MMVPSSDTGNSLVDLSDRPRIGIKGGDISRWVESQGYAVGDASNRAYRQRDGSLLVRLSPGELLHLADPDGPSAGPVAFSLDASYLCYPVRRQDSHYWFALSGEQSADMLATLCAVNLSPDAFPNSRVAQTSVARTNAIVVRDDSVDAIRYYLLGDSSMKMYMCSCLDMPLNLARQHP